MSSYCFSQGDSLKLKKTAGSSLRHSFIQIGDSLYGLFSEQDITTIVLLVANFDGCKEELKMVYSADSSLQLAYNGLEVIVSRLTDDGKKYKEIIKLQEEEIAMLKVEYEKQLRKERRRKKILGVTTYTLAGFAAVMTLLYIAK